MIARNLKRETRATIYGLPAVACLVLLTILATVGGLNSAKAQNRVRTYSQSEVERLIRDVEQSSKDFQRDFDNWLDHSPLDRKESLLRVVRRV